MGMENKGFDEEIVKMQNLDDLIDQSLQEQLDLLCVDWQGAAKDAAPHDTGALRENIVTDGAAKSGAVWRMEVYTNQHYAAHVEHGHRQKVGQFVKAIGKRLVKPYVKGFFYMRDSRREAYKTLPKRVEMGLSDVARKVKG